MKLKKRWICLTLILGLNGIGGFDALTSPVLVLAAEVDRKQGEGCVTNYDPNKDYFSEKLSVDYADGFQVSYHKHYKKVKVVAPWKKGGETFDYILVQCGTPTPKGFEDAQIVSIPARTMLVLSSTYYYFVEQLGLLDRVIGISEFKRVNSPAILKLIEEKKIVDVGRNVDLNLEFTTQLNPDIIMTYGTGNPFRDRFRALMQFGIRVGVFAEYMETEPLGRAEWLKFMALFFNREAKATTVFRDIETRYLAMKQVTKDVKKKPTVFTGNSIQGTWFMAGGRSYKARFLRDAGAAFLWADDDSPGSLSMDLESVLKKAARADYWLDTGQWKSLQDALSEDTRYRFFSAFEQSKVYNNNAVLNRGGGNDYWERGIVNPHLVLADMIKIFHPELLPKHQLVWYRHLQ